MDMIKVKMWTKPRSYNFVDYDLAKTHSYYSIVFFKWATVLTILFYFFINATVLTIVCQKKRSCLRFLKCETKEDSWRLKLNVDGNID